MAEPLTPEEVSGLLQIINEQKAEIARLRSEQPLLGVLREIAIDPSVPPHIRLKAAEVGVGYETPRLSATLSHITGGRDFGDRLDAARKRRDAERRGLRLIEAEPA